jgi:sporulation protein YlmC with PRC-barrel domain
MERYARDDVTGLAGREVFDRDGTTVGYVDLVFVDHESGRPEWIGVWNGLPTGRRTLVPLRGVEVGESEVRVPWPEDVIRDAQTYDEEDDRGIVREDPDGIAISPEKERAAYEHYGLEPEVTPRAGVVRLRAVVVSVRTSGR